MIYKKPYELVIEIAHIRKHLQELENDVAELKLAIKQKSNEIKERYPNYKGKECQL